MFVRTSNPFKAERPKPKKKRSTQPVKDRAVWAALAEDIEELRKANARILPGTWNLPDANEFSYALVTLIERDSDSAYLYKPLKVGDEFHQCMCHEVGLSGSNRAGKTIAASAEVGMAAMGLHYVKEKYPKDKVQIACVGNDGRHLSLMYEYLFEKAPYRIYQHPVTMIWSIVDENCPEANKYKHLWEEAKPFIPERMVQEVAWEDKKEKIPSLVRLYNGTVIRFYSGLVKKLPQGRKFHLCLAGRSKIYDPVENRYRRIDTIDSSFHVQSYDRKNKSMVVKRSSKPFIKGYGDICRVSLSNGQEIYTTPHHQVLTVSGEWVSVIDAMRNGHDIFCPASSESLHLSATFEQKQVMCHSDSQSEHYSCHEKETVIHQHSSASIALPKNGNGYGDERAQNYHASGKCCQGNYSSCLRHRDEQSHEVQDIDQVSVQEHGDEATRIQPSLRADDKPCECKGICRCEPDYLKVSFSEIHAALAGASSRQPSRTLLARMVAWCEDAARCQLKSCPDGKDGLSLCHQELAGSRSIPDSGCECQHPLAIASQHDTTSYSGDTASQSHDAQRYTIGKALSSGEMASYDNNPDDELSLSVKISGIEVIGQEPIWDISVEDTHTYFYGGVLNHNCWIDEEIENPKRWIEEMRARIVDYNGRIFWSATPQRASQEFFDMELKATDPENEDKPLSQKTAFFVMRSTDNIYISKEGNEAFLAKMKDDDEQLQTRWFGQSARSFLTVYPEYGEHNLINDYNPRYEDTNYIIIDPGVDVAGVLFAVCPQQEQHYNYDRLSEEEKWYRSRPDCLVIYDELYIKRANPDMVAEAIKNKRLQYPVTWLQDLTIDQRGGKSMIWRGMGKDESCEGLYMSALKRYEVLPRPENVDRWQYGSSDIKFGVDKTKTMLVKGFDKLPRLFIHRRCKKLMWEFKAWQKKRDSRGEFIGYQEGNNHLLDCLRYATTRELKWVSPPESMKHKPIDLRQTMADLKSGKSFFT